MHLYFFISRLVLALTHFRLFYLKSDALSRWRSPDLWSDRPLAVWQNQSVIIMNYKFPVPTFRASERTSTSLWCAEEEIWCSPETILRVCVFFCPHFDNYRSVLSADWYVIRDPPGINLSLCKLSSAHQKRIVVLVEAPWRICHVSAATIQQVKIFHLVWHHSSGRDGDAWRVLETSCSSSSDFCTCTVLYSFVFSLIVVPRRQRRSGGSSSSKLQIWSDLFCNHLTRHLWDVFVHRVSISCFYITIFCPPSDAVEFM